MQIIVNGKTEQVADSINITNLLKYLSLDQRRLAVEVNQIIVPHSQYDAHKLFANDQIEIVQAIGGG